MISPLLWLSRHPIQTGAVLALALQLVPCRVGAAQGPPAKPAAPSAPAPAIPKAVFEEELPTGRDPFFPKSQRRARIAPPPNGANQPPVFNPLSQLVLKGLSLGKQRRLALINNVTLAEGETAVVKLGEQAATIRCLRIREESVLVGIDGTKETKELQPPKGT